MIKTIGFWIQEKLLTYINLIKRNQILTQLFLNIKKLFVNIKKLQVGYVYSVMQM